MKYNKLILGAIVIASSCVIYEVPVYASSSWGMNVGVSVVLIDEVHIALDMMDKQDGVTSATIQVFVESNLVNANRLIEDTTEIVLVNGDIEEVVEVPSEEISSLLRIVSEVTTITEDTLEEVLEMEEEIVSEIIVETEVEETLEEVVQAVVTDQTVIQNIGVASILIDEVVIIEDKEVQQQIADEQTWGYTNLGIANVDNHLNVRETASETGKLVGKLPRNAACEILSFDGVWAKVVSGEVEGYVSTQYLLMGSIAVERANEVVATMATVQADALKIRELPNTDCEVVTTVARGEQLEVVDSSLGDWIKITLDSEEVYVAAEFVSINDQLPTAITMTELLYGVGVSDIRVDLVNYAKQFIGNPYKWGGTSLTNGADCSGFVQSVFKNFGISLPRTSSSQSAVGTTISSSDLVAGDLIFYGQSGRINHVAIYMGNGQVVHASTASTGIKVSNAFYRQPSVIKRILP